MRLLVTGGAGFIGSAVVRRAIEDGDEVLVLDKLTYAGNLASLDARGGEPALRLRARRHLRSRAPSTRRSSDFSPDVVMHLAAESHVDRSIDGPARLHPDQRGRDVRPAVGGARLLARRSKARGARALPLPARLDRRSVRLARAGGLVSRRHALSRRIRPIRPPRPASDHLVRAWRHTYGLPTIAHQLLEQLRALSFPREADSADDPQRARRQAAAGLRARPERARLAVCRGPRRGAAAGRASAARPARAYNVGGRSERRNIDVVADDLRLSRRTCAARRAAPIAS